MFREIFESEFTWVSGFMRNVFRFGSKTAVIDPQLDRIWTYSHLNDEVNRLSNALLNSGVNKGDVVLIQLFNSPQFLFAYIAAQKIGAVINPINFKLSPSETASIISHNKPKAYFYDTEVSETAVKALQISEHRPEVVVAVNNSRQLSDCTEHILYDAFVKDSSTENPKIDYKLNIYDESVRLQTSGTTGIPKGVPLNSINEVMSAHDVIMHFPMNHTDITMNMTPWFHRGGLHSGGPTPTLYVGAALVIMRSFNPKLTISWVEKYGITYLTGVPSVLEMLANRQEKHPSDLRTLRGIVTMGSPLEKKACIRFQKLLTQNIFNGYGTTESFWNTFLRPFDLPEMAGTAGRSSTDDEVRVVKMYDDKKASPDELVPMDGKTEGEVIIKSPSKAVCFYYDNELATNEKFLDGWMYTGDIGTWDENQFITICGRQDDMIISKGENIYPVKIEEVINKHPKVHECIVTGVPDKTRGEVVVAYIIPEDGSLTVSEISEFLLESHEISDFQMPRYFRFIDQLPSTATGKKQHYIIKQQAKKDLESGLLVRN